MTEDSLIGKTALITGSAQRIGRETALTLADAGINIIIHYRHSKDEAHELKDELKRRGVRAWTLEADLSHAKEYQTLIHRAYDTAGSIDILINNASEFPMDSLDNITFDSLTTGMEINAWAPFILCRLFVEQAKSGKIINMLDSRLSGYDWTHVSYILSKHVLGVLTRMMAVKYAPEFTVNGIAPGLILPPPGKDESYIDRMVHTVPLQKHGNPEDVSDAILYLLKSDFVTGQVIYVDGGRHLKEYVVERPELE